MGNDRKKKFTTVFSITEIKILEKHFAEMAAKGWLIDKINLFSMEYKRIEPQEMTFFVDVLPRLSAFDYPNNSEVQKYRKATEETGWKFAAYSKQVQVFYYCKATDDIPPSIHADNKTEARNILKIFLKYEFFFFLYGFVMLLIGLTRIISNGYNLFLSNISIAMVLFSALVSVPYIWYLAFMSLWVIKIIICIKNDSALPIINDKIAKIRGHSFIFTLAVGVVLMLTAMALEIINGMPTLLLFGFISPFLGLGIGFLIRKRIDTKERSKTANIVLAICTIVVVAVFSSSIAMFLISSLGSHQQEPPHALKTLYLSDVGVEGEPNFYNYYSLKSVAVPINYTYYEGNKSGNVSVTVKKAVNSFLIGRIYNETLEELRKMEWRSISIMPAETVNSLGALEGYFLNDSGTYFILRYKYSFVLIDYMSENGLSDNVRKKIEDIGKQK